MQLQASGNLRCVVYEMLFFLFFRRVRVGGGEEEENTGKIADSTFDF